ncbi:flagellar basal body protein FliL [Hoeflea sp. BAL378]|uniref:flagellar basal body-associated FliL family protein n=1 Tax=Hoeflea sp. BAL378 TaxID=1547437 RepID=UPI0005145014|nr:flagellar basal body-associated FliL family protein [Hoeflea sp. BAL378]KGF68530.1 flagellar basal body protein FliL [Hoeflea sp. BAL378]
MADTEEETEGAGKKKSGLIVTIAIVLVLSLLAGGGGWVLGGILAPKVAQPEEEAAAAAAAPHGGAEGEKEGEGEIKARENLVQLEPITTNLSYPSDNWIRIEVSLVFTGETDDELADQIHQDILAYLRTVSLQQIEGPRGFQYLRDDLRERVKLRSEGRVNDLLLRTFVIE